MNPSNSASSTNTKGESTPPHSPITSKSSFPYVSAVGVDIGGSFTKLVYWRPPAPPNLPSTLPLKPDPSLKVQLTGPGLDGNLRFLKFPSSRTLEFVQFAAETHLHEQYGPGKTKVVMATGGGSYKYATVIKEKLGVTLQQQDEMKCLIRGLNFLLLNVDNEAFTYSWREQKQNFLSRAKSKQSDSNYPFPYLLVNIGSGVSILKVENEDTYERVSGSSLGGGTFWGLCRLLTDITDFDQVREMSKKGDNTHVDLMVGDIYGCDYDALGLKSDVIASSFGRVATKKEGDQEDFHPKNEDIVRSLLFMMCNNMAQIGYLNAKLMGVRRIFFSGGFLQENAYVWSRFSYSVDFWSKGEMEATFLLHNSYLGAVGALLQPHSNVEQN